MAHRPRILTKILSLTRGHDCLVGRVNLPLTGHVQRHRHQTATSIHFADGQGTVHARFEAAREHMVTGTVEAKGRLESEWGIEGKK